MGKGIPVELCRLFHKLLGLAQLIVTLKQVINRWSAHLWSSCGQPHKHRTNLFLHQAVNNINHISLKCCPASICHWVSTHLQK